MRMKTPRSLHIRTETIHSLVLLWISPLWDQTILNFWFYCWSPCGRFQSFSFVINASRNITIMDLCIWISYPHFSENFPYWTAACHLKNLFHWLPCFVIAFLGVGFTSYLKWNWMSRLCQVKRKIIITQRYFLRRSKGWAHIYRWLLQRMSWPCKTCKVRGCKFSRFDPLTCW